jgi:MFS family permease
MKEKIEKSQEEKEETEAIKIKEKVLSSHNKDAKELAKWQKQKARKKPKAYLWYLMLILTLVYIVDEVATNMNSTMQPYMVTDFFVNGMGLSQNDGQAAWQGYGVIGLVAMVFVIFYRPLADRFGRKIFLVINTFCMSVGMILCFYSPVFAVYLVGYVFITFMTGPDMQVVYITECAPKKHRAAFVSVIKGIAQLGIALIAIGMSSFMKNNDSMWRWVFLIPACIGFAVSFLVLFFARETDQFIDERIAYLSLTDEEKIALLSDKAQKNANAQGGVIATAKFGFKHYQLKWLFIASLLYTTAFYGTATYGQILSNGGYSTLESTDVGLVWPFVCSFITIIYGIFSDKYGRKKVSTALGLLVIVGITLLSCSLYFGWSPYATGVFLGLFLAGYWNWGDTIILMVSESSPTNLRSSASGDQSLFAAAGYLVGYITIFLFTKFSSADVLRYTDFVYLALAISGVLGAVLVIALKAKETRGVDLNTIRGDEWDKPAQN